MNSDIESKLNQAFGGKVVVLRLPDDQPSEPEARTVPKLSPLALYGLAGEAVTLASEYSEASKAAMLTTFLTRFSAQVGNRVYVNIGEEVHTARLFTGIVGASSTARKGTSASAMGRFFEEANALLGSPANDAARYEVDLDSAMYDVVSVSGLSTGEGLIHRVRDGSGEGEDADQGIVDKRLFVLEGELALSLQAASRQGNTLSAILRDCWDASRTRTIGFMTKHSQTKATGAHIAIVGHITLTELNSLLAKSDVHNGFANRFLWVYAQREKRIAFPERMPNERVQPLAIKLAESLHKVALLGGKVITFDAKAKQYYSEAYLAGHLDGGDSGVYAAVTTRAPAYVQRLALIYCLLDGEQCIRFEHLEAATMLWQYCQDSARFVFDEAKPNPLLERITNALKDKPLTQTEISHALQRHVSAAQISAALEQLQVLGRVECELIKGKGRPSKVWKLTK